jgi:hypothetical protein
VPLFGGFIHPGSPRDLRHLRDMRHLPRAKGQGLRHLPAGLASQPDSLRHRAVQWSAPDCTNPHGSAIDMTHVTQMTQVFPHLGSVACDTGESMATLAKEALFGAGALGGFDIASMPALIA